MSQLFVGISTRSTDPSKITPLIVCTLSSISYEIKGKKSDFFCLSSWDSISTLSSRGEAVAIQGKIVLYLKSIWIAKQPLCGHCFTSFAMTVRDIALQQRGLNLKATRSRYACSSYPPSLSTSAMSCLIEDSISSESSCSWAIFSASSR